jgi:hypothetical protein
MQEMQDFVFFLKKGENKHNFVQKQSPPFAVPPILGVTSHQISSFFFFFFLDSNQRPINCVYLPLFYFLIKYYIVGLN